MTAEGERRIPRLGGFACVVKQYYQCVRRRMGIARTRVLVCVIGSGLGAKGG